MSVKVTPVAVFIAIPLADITAVDPMFATLAVKVAEVFEILLTEAVPNPGVAEAKVETMNEVDLVELVPLAITTKV